MWKENKVHGYNAYVWIKEGSGKVVEEEIHQCITPRDLQEKHPSSSAVYANNPNCHKVKKQLRGCIGFFKEHKIVAVVEKTKETGAVVRQLHPKVKQGEDERMVVDLRFDGYWLEQIAGAPSVKFSKDMKRHKTVKEGVVQPLLDSNGNIMISNDGPDIASVDKTPDAWLKVLNAYVGKERLLSEREPPGGKNRKMASEVATVYILPSKSSDLKEIRKITKLVKGKEVSEPLYCIPIGVERVSSSGRYNIQCFADVSGETMKEFLSRGWEEGEKKDTFLFKHAVKVFDLIVPQLVNGEIRMNVVTEKEFEELKAKGGMEEVTSQCWKRRYLFGYEPRDLKDSHCRGTMMSYWNMDDFVGSINISYEMTRGIIGCYRRGMERKSVPQKGSFSIRGPRISELSNATPLVPRENVRNQQYYSKENGNLLLQPVLERKLHHMVTMSKHFARKANKPVQELIPDQWLSQGLLSTGYTPKPSRKRKRGPVFAENRTYSHQCTFALANVSHIDKDDALHKATLEELKRQAKKKGSAAALKVLDSGLFCVPTTCGYQFVYESKEAKMQLVPSQYFALDGLGLAMRIEDGIGHHFLGASFSHRSCLSICRRKDGLVSARNDKNNFQIVGWGACGGGDEAEENPADPLELLGAATAVPVNGNAGAAGWI